MYITDTKQATHVHSTMVYDASQNASQNATLKLYYTVLFLLRCIVLLQVILSTLILYIHQPTLHQRKVNCIIKYKHFWPIEVSKIVRCRKGDDPVRKNQVWPGC